MLGVIRRFFIYVVKLCLFANIVCFTPAYCFGPAPALGQDDASAVVEAHLSAIKAQDYSEAESWFSDAFRAAIMPKVKFVNSYLLELYIAMHGGGFELSSPLPLEEERFVLISATLPETAVFYYLIKQANGWRIEAFSEYEFSTMADGRRELYLFTNRDWNDDDSKELKCRASLFQIQRELETYKDEKGEGFYPTNLKGGRMRDPLTIWGYFDMDKGYPVNHFNSKPMYAAEFALSLRKPSAGDFSYIPLDNNGDGKMESYYLVSWGRGESKNVLFEGTAIIGLLAGDDERQEKQIITDFIEYVIEHFGVSLALKKV